VRAHIADNHSLEPGKKTQKKPTPARIQIVRENKQKRMINNDKFCAELNIDRDPESAKSFIGALNPGIRLGGGYNVGIRFDRDSGGYLFGRMARTRSGVKAESKRRRWAVVSGCSRPPTLIHFQRLDYFSLGCAEKTCN